MLFASIFIYIVFLFLQGAFGEFHEAAGGQRGRAAGAAARLSKDVRLQRAHICLYTAGAAASSQ